MPRSQTDLSEPSGLPKVIEKDTTAPSFVTRTGAPSLFDPAPPWRSVGFEP